METTVPTARPAARVPSAAACLAAAPGLRSASGGLAEATVSEALDAPDRAFEALDFALEEPLRFADAPDPDRDVEEERFELDPPERDREAGFDPPPDRRELDEPEVERFDVDDEPERELFVVELAFAEPDLERDPPLLLEPDFARVEEPLFDAPLDRDDDAFAEPLAREPELLEVLLDEPDLDEPLAREPELLEPAFVEPLLDEAVFVEPRFVELLFVDPLFVEAPAREPEPLPDELLVEPLLLEPPFVELGPDVEDPEDFAPPPEPFLALADEPFELAFEDFVASAIFISPFDDPHPCGSRTFLSSSRYPSRCGHDPRCDH
ncbi:hypothetical protein HJD18_04070 [Thermoleophilia bacterium SCSIO 60948]|nr:hypothetical protein HJD18_04070 [Thermoleophilia bacterium SCSIO 60948]